MPVNFCVNWTRLEALAAQSGAGYTLWGSLENLKLTAASRRRSGYTCSIALAAKSTVYSLPLRLHQYPVESTHDC